VGTLATLAARQVPPNDRSAEIASTEKGVNEPQSATSRLKVVVLVCIAFGLLGGGLAIAFRIRGAVGTEVTTAPAQNDSAGSDASQDIATIQSRPTVTHIVETPPDGEVVQTQVDSQIATQVVEAQRPSSLSNGAKSGKSKSANASAAERTAGVLGNGGPSDLDLASGFDDDASLPVLTIAMPIVRGNLDKAIVRRYLKMKTAPMTACAVEHFKSKSAQSGTLNVSFFIDESGHVARSAADGFNVEIGRCVSDIVGRIEFPLPSEGGGVDVNVAVSFQQPK
jgi:hypothetical protein